MLFGFYHLLGIGSILGKYVIGAGEYVINDANTNTINGFWGLIKRGTILYVIARHEGRVYSSGIV